MDGPGSPRDANTARIGGTWSLTTDSERPALSIAMPPAMLSVMPSAVVQEIGAAARVPAGRQPWRRDAKSLNQASPRGGSGPQGGERGGLVRPAAPLVLCRVVTPKMTRHR